MQSAYHNLPTIGGVMQQEGRRFAASDVTRTQGEASSEFSLGIAGAYPKEAGIASWKRTVRLNRGKNVEVVDSYELSRRADAITLSLMTPCAVTVVEPGKLALAGEDGKFGSATILYDAKTFDAAAEDVVLEDEALVRKWDTDRLKRIVLTAKRPDRKGNWTVTVKP